MKQKKSLTTAVILMLLLFVASIFNKSHTEINEVQSLVFQNEATYSSSTIMDKIIEELNSNEFLISGHDLNIYAHKTDNENEVMVEITDQYDSTSTGNIVFSISSSNDNNYVYITFDAGYYYEEVVDPFSYCGDDYLDPVYSTWEYHLYAQSTIDIFEEIIAIVGTYDGYELDEIFDNGTYTFENINSDFEDAYAINVEMQSRCMYAISGDNIGSAGEYSMLKTFTMQISFNTQDEDETEDENIYYDIEGNDTDDTTLNAEENPNTGSFVNYGILIIILIITIIEIRFLRKKNSIFKL